MVRLVTDQCGKCECYNHGASIIVLLCMVYTFSVPACMTVLLQCGQIMVIIWAEAGRGPGLALVNVIMPCDVRTVWVQAFCV